MIRLALTTVSFCVVGLAQNVEPHSFEVASVRPDAPGNGTARPTTRGGPGTADPERVSYVHMTLSRLLMLAYGVEADQVSGPGWLTSDKFNVDAKIPANTTRDQFRRMLQNLLAERFGVAIHREKKDFPVYELFVAKGGPKIRQSGVVAGPSPSPAPGTPSPNLASDKNGFPILPPGVREAGKFDSGMMRSAYRNYPMSDLVGALVPLVSIATGGGLSGHPRVIDRTELAGEFDFTLEFAGSPFPTPTGGGGTAARSEQGASMDLPTDPGAPGPSLFTALEKQLGLRLAASRAQLDVLVIDHATRIPVEN